MQVDVANKKVVLIAFMGKLFPTKFLFFFSKSLSSNIVELMFQAQKHMTLEDVMVARRDQENEHQERLKRKRDKRLKFIEGELRTRETVD